MGRYGEIWGDVDPDSPSRLEIWGDMGRYGEMWIRTPHLGWWRTAAAARRTGWVACATSSTCSFRSPAWPPAACRRDESPGRRRLGAAAGVKRRCHSLPSRAASGAFVALDPAVAAESGVHLVPPRVALALDDAEDGAAGEGAEEACNLPMRADGQVRVAEVDQVLEPASGRGEGVRPPPSRVRVCGAAGGGVLAARMAAPMIV